MDVAVLDIPKGGYDGELGFEIRGEKFTFSVENAHPDTYARIFNADSDEQYLAYMDAWIEAALWPPEDIDRWRDLRSPLTEPPLWYDEILAVARHIGGLAGKRPTMPSNGSSATAASSGTGSTAVSPSPEAAVSPI